MVILHGVNMVYKRPPYHAAAAGFDGPDADFLAEHGFNTVRLGLIYKAVEPSPAPTTRPTSTRSRRPRRSSPTSGIFSQLDFHQDLYNERLRGEGWPDWATIDDGFPAQPLTGFPGSYFSSPGLNRAFDNFWANDRRARAASASRTATPPPSAASPSASPRAQHTIGYDLMNEPWPGSVVADLRQPRRLPGLRHQHARAVPPAGDRRGSARSSRRS